MFGVQRVLHPRRAMRPTLQQPNENLSRCAKTTLADSSSKNSNAAKCALQIKYIVQRVLRPKFEAKYDSVNNASFKIDHGVGVDTGTVLAVRAGARGANDLIWIDRAPNLAAKLSDIRDAPYQSFITASVFNRLNDRSKFGGEDNKLMWESRVWTFLGQKISVYRSSWYWSP